MARRYGRAHFIKDAARLGLAPEMAFSRAELRRRRDHLMATHHPDRGGDTRKAARINAIYGRMVAWLNARPSREVERAGSEPSLRADTLHAADVKAGLRLGAARIWGLAMVAAATYMTLRRRSKP